MRLWHMVLTVFLVAVGLTLARDAAGRVAFVVFVTGSGEMVFGTIAVMALFRTVGAIGEADCPSAYAEAVAATAMVLTVATAVMIGLFWIGLFLLRAVISA